MLGHTGNRPYRLRTGTKTEKRKEHTFLRCRISFFGFAAFMLKWRQSARYGAFSNTSHY